MNIDTTTNTANQTIVTETECRTDIAQHLKDHWPGWKLVYQP